MKRIFEHIGGVPPRLRFDNMTTAVAQVLKDGERVLTEGFTRFMLHYRFQADFCNPASGNEKGNVENKVGYSRRNAFVPVPVITSFEEFNEQLLEWCEKDADRLHYKHKVPIRELWEEDKAALLELPQYPFSVFRYGYCFESLPGGAACPLLYCGGVGKHPAGEEHQGDLEQLPGYAEKGRACCD